MTSPIGKSSISEHSSNSTASTESFHQKRDLTETDLKVPKAKLPIVVMGSTRSISIKATSASGAKIEINATGSKMPSFASVIAGKNSVHVNAVSVSSSKAESSEKSILRAKASSSHKQLKESSSDEETESSEEAPPRASSSHQPRLESSSDEETESSEETNVRMKSSSSEETESSEEVPSRASSSHQPRLESSSDEETESSEEIDVRTKHSSAKNTQAKVQVQIKRQEDLLKDLIKSTGAGQPLHIEANSCQKYSLQGSLNCAKEHLQISSSKFDEIYSYRLKADDSSLKKVTVTTREYTTFLKKCAIETLNVGGVEARECKITSVEAEYIKMKKCEIGNILFHIANQNQKAVYLNLSGSTVTGNIIIKLDPPRISIKSHSVAVALDIPERYRSFSEIPRSVFERYSFFMPFDKPVLFGGFECKKTIIDGETHYVSLEPLPKIEVTIKGCTLLGKVMFADCEGSVVYTK